MGGSGRWLRAVVCSLDFSGVECGCRKLLVWGAGALPSSLRFVGVDLRGLRAVGRSVTVTMVGQYGKVRRGIGCLERGRGRCAAGCLAGCLTDMPLDMPLDVPLGGWEASVRRRVRVGRVRVARGTTGLGVEFTWVALDRIAL
jgi:hypothetical protein